MRNSIYPFVFIAGITLSSCSSVMNNLPGVYSLEIQQGNIVNQEMIDQLRPNMTKRQVLYIMGSPMLVDIFHQKRWDYLYSTQPGGEPRRQKRLSLFFDGDKLIGVQGDFRPSTVAVARKSNETSFELPKRNLDNTLWGKMTRLMNDEPPPIPEEHDDEMQANFEDTLDVEANDLEKQSAAVVQEHDITLDKNAIESETTNAIKTNSEQVQAVENGEIAITPLQENNVQVIEEVDPVSNETIEQSAEPEQTSTVEEEQSN